MKKTFYWTLALLFVGAFCQNMLLAQQTTTTRQSTASTTSTDPIRVGTTPNRMGKPLKAGEHVPNEIIYWYEVAPSPADRVLIKDKLKDYDIFVKEWSPSGKYLLAISEDPEFDACEWADGEGHPDGDPTPEQEEEEEEGQGHGVDLNHIVGTQGYSFADPYNCNEPSERALEEYTPIHWCDAPYPITPAVGTSNVRIAIIDSGIQGSSQGSINGVSYDQVIVPRECTSEECPVDTDFPTSEGMAFHRHGTYAAELISGWAQTNGLAAELHLTAYQILNNDLRCTAFQAIKAIEYATLAAQKPHIISMSFGFMPGECSVPGQPSILQTALRGAQEAGIVLITSAGNEGDDLSDSPIFPAAEPGLDNLVTVGALTCSDGEIAGWSNYSNEHVDLLIPGDRIRTIHYGCFEEVSGTSFACPLVTAKAAFHVSTQSVFDANEVLCRLRTETTPFDGAIYGRVNSDADNGICNVSELGGTPLTVTETKTSATSAYPNPFTDQVKVILPDLPANETAMLRVFDLKGKLILREKRSGSHAKLDLSTQKSGVYWLSINSSLGVETFPIMKK